MYSIERQEKIRKYLARTGSVSVSDLSRILSASRETIRRDLCQMETQGLLRRTHGGAVIISKSFDTAEEAPVSYRTERNIQEKEAICREAAGIIQDGDTIFVDNSTTCLSLCNFLPPDFHLTFLTNSIGFLMECSKHHNPQHTFICLGGMFKQSNLSIYGNMAIKNASQYFPNKAFISCSGIDPMRQITDSGFQEIDIKRALCKSSQHVYLLADHTKFKKIGQIYLCNADAVGTIITDRLPDEDILKFLQNSGVSVKTAERKSHD